jgi:hypothetical protein
MSALALLILRSSASQDWICRTSNSRSLRLKSGRSLKSYPWTRLLVPMGLLVTSTGRAGRSSDSFHIPAAARRTILFFGGSAAWVFTSRRVNSARNWNGAFVHH